LAGQLQIMGVNCVDKLLTDVIASVLLGL